MKYDHLLGKPFRMGEQDCYTLVRGFFADNFDIHLPNYARPTDWSSANLDLMRQYYARNGFVMHADWKRNDLRPGDVLAMAIGDSNANHFAIYVGDNTIIHHIFNRFSNEEVFRDFWRNCVCFMLRHPDVPDLTPVLPDTDLETLLRARHRHIPNS